MKIWPCSVQGSFEYSLKTKYLHSEYNFLFQVALKVIFGSLVQISRIFYYLNYQDLPEFFEDNIAVWMGHFLNLLESDNKLLHTDEDEEPGILEELKSQICDNIGKGHRNIFLFVVEICLRSVLKNKRAAF